MTPLTKLSRELEQTYRETILERTRTADRETYLETLTRKSASIYRSMLIIDKLDDIPEEVCDLLTENHQLINDIGRVITLLRLGDDRSFPQEVGALMDKFNVPPSEMRPDGSVVTGRELLVAAMFRRLNSEFGRIKLAE
jgi:hypothetical protein